MLKALAAILISYSLFVGLYSYHRGTNLESRIADLENRIECLESN